jgi:hypothetical protein
MKTTNEIRDKIPTFLASTINKKINIYKLIKPMGKASIKNP